MESEKVINMDVSNVFFYLGEFYMEKCVTDKSLNYFEKALGVLD